MASKRTTLKAAYAGMGKGFEEMKARISSLEAQERRLIWLIERGATVSKFQGKYRVADQNSVMSEWHDDPAAAIDEAMES